MTTCKMTFGLCVCVGVFVCVCVHVCVCGCGWGCVGCHMYQVIEWSWRLDIINAA